MGKKTKITVSTGKLQNEYILEDFKKDAITVGRGRDNDIVVRGAKVSNNHGCFFKENGKWYYQDLNSTNGTICNGQKIVKAELTENAKFVLDSSVVDDSVVINVSVGDFDSTKSKGSNIKVDADESGSMKTGKTVDSKKTSKEKSVEDKKFKRIAIILSASIATVIIGLVVFLLVSGSNNSSGGGGGAAKRERIGSITVTIDKSILQHDETFDMYFIPEEFQGFSGTIDGPENYLSEIKYQILDANNVEVSNGKLEVSEGAWKITSPSMMLGSNTLIVTVIDKENRENSDSVIFSNDDEKYMENVTIDTDDKDGDGLIAYLESSIGTDDNNSDTDGDGLQDGVEYLMTGTDPTKYDTEGDGVCDADRDSDSDGLVNKIEVELGTDPGVGDSDGDGLLDGEEVNDHKTNPLLADTDEDEASDMWEIQNGTNPLVKDESFIVKLECGTNSSMTRAMINMDYKGNPENIRISSVNNPLLSEEMTGYMGEPYYFDFPTGEDLLAEIEMRNKLIEEEKRKAAIYRLDEDTQLLFEVETNIENGVATAKIERAGIYVLLDKEKVDEALNTDIKTQEELAQIVVKVAFVIDYSKSMDENDPNYQRIEIVKEYLSHLRTDYDYASIVQFARIAKTLVPMTSNIDSCVEAVGNIVNNDGSTGCGSSGEAGTNGTAGFMNALAEFPDDDDESTYKSIIFLSDGEDTVDETEQHYDEVIDEAKNKNIRIYTIGLGDIDEDLLRRIANETGGEYYKASEISDADISLQEAFSEIQGLTIPEIDSNGDGILDYYVTLMKEGKLRTGTNINPIEGLLDELLDEKDWDGDGINNGDELQIVKEGDKIYIKLLSYPLLKDSDMDGYDDKADNRPLKWDVGDRDLAIFAGICYDDVSNDVIGVEGGLKDYFPAFNEIGEKKAETFTERYFVYDVESYKKMLTNQMRIRCHLITEL